MTTLFLGVPFPRVPAPSLHGSFFSLQKSLLSSSLPHLRSVGLLALIVWSLLQMVFGWHQQWLMAWFGALLFSGFILFDTWMTMDKCDISPYF